MFSYHADGTQPTPGDVFVFGSNLAGKHCGGAARAAFNHYGAVMGTHSGMQGSSYAIPTKDAEIAETLPLDVIRRHVMEFTRYTHEHRDRRFFVTRVGCGLAGLRDEDVAPMFALCADNCDFPEPWRPHLENAADAAVRGSYCRASRGDGECNWEGCPQLRDGEPEKTGRHCPLDVAEDDDG